MSKRALAYVGDIILGRTGEVISREYQKKLIELFAEENDIDIIEWFEDEMYSENVMERPGVKAMLDCDRDYEIVLVERVWCLSRSWPTLNPFFDELDRRNIEFKSAITMWDCVSQMARHRFDETLKQPTAKREKVIRKSLERVKIQRPKHFHFTGLSRHADQSAV